MPKEMYYLIPFISGGIIVLLGLYSFIKPEKNVRKEKRGLPLEIAKVKKNGIVLMILGILIITIEVVGRL